MKDSEILKQLKETKKRVIKEGWSKQYRVLARKNDPFWVTHARERNAKWLAEIYEEDPWDRIHDRGLHYLLVSMGIECPWGKNRKVHSSANYMNVDSDSSALVNTSRDARYWNLIPWDCISDELHGGLKRRIDYGRLEGNRQRRPLEGLPDKFSAWGEGTDLYGIPEFKPEFTGEGFDGFVDTAVSKLVGEISSPIANRYQPYYCAVGTEKVGLEKVANDVLRDLDYGFDWLDFTGQSSATGVKGFVHRLLSDRPPEHPIRKKKIRIFYLSDFDSAGRTMPPAFVWKLHFLLTQEGVRDSLDLKLRPLALTEEQVEKYELPPAPVPAKKLGQKTLQDRWLRDFGQITEIDSLIALHKGELQKIIKEEIEKFTDSNLSDSISNQIREIKSEVEDRVREAVEERYEDWKTARENLSELMEEYEKIFEKYKPRKLVSEYRRSLSDIEVDTSDIEDVDTESDFEADEEGFWLYDTKMSEREQAKKLKEYKP